jgi:hypothetical protein
MQDPTLRPVRDDAAGARAAGIAGGTPEHRGRGDYGCADRHRGNRDTEHPERLHDKKISTSR